MKSTFQQAVDIVADYLGPAAERFLRRQITFHLDKEPEELTAAEVKQLAEWVRTSLGLLTQDKELVEECSRRLGKLAQSLKA